jgi:hypothetical protein
MKLSMRRLKVTRRYYSALPENLKTFKSVFGEWEELVCRIETVELRYVDYVAPNAR